MNLTQRPQRPGVNLAPEERGNVEDLLPMLLASRTVQAQPDVRLRLGPGEREPEYAPPFKPDGSHGPGAREAVADESYALLLIKARAEGRQLTEAELTKLKQQAAGDAPTTKKKKGAK